MNSEQLTYLENVNRYLRFDCAIRADENIMRSFEMSLGIPEQSADDFRRSVVLKCYLYGDDEAFKRLELLGTSFGRRN